MTSLPLVSGNTYLTSLPLVSGNTYLTSFQLVSVRNHGHVNSVKVEIEFHLEHVLNSAGWDTLDTTYKKRLVVLTHKCLNNLAAHELKNLFKPNRPERNMRSKHSTIRLPTPETNYIRNSVSYRGALLWNSLDLGARVEPKLGALKRHLEEDRSIRDFKVMPQGKSSPKIKPTIIIEYHL